MSSTIRAAKNIIRQNIPLYCAATIITDLAQGLALSLGYSKRTSGRGQENRYFDINGTLTYEKQIFGEYCRYTGKEKFTGRVCELGPGGDLGIPLMFVMAGASEAHAVERFSTLRPQLEQQDIYLSISGDATLPKSIAFYFGAQHKRFFVSRPKAYEGIFSASVIEHVGNPLVRLDEMESALAPAGIMVHIIDLADHLMFGTGRHPLEFLTIPSIVYRQMARYSGRPNRVMFHQYRQWTSRRNAKLLVRRLIGQSELPCAIPFSDLDPDSAKDAIRLAQAFRPRLCSDFRNVSDEDLAVAECVLVACATEDGAIRGGASVLHSGH